MSAQNAFEILSKLLQALIFIIQLRDQENENTERDNIISIQ